MRPNGARLIVACPRRSTRYCARLAGPSCLWMSQRIIIETLPSSDRSRWMVAKTALSPQGVVVGDREPRDWTCAHFGSRARADPQMATAISGKGQTLEGD